MTNKIRHTIYCALFVFVIPVIQPVKAQQNDTVLVTVPVLNQAHIVSSANSYTAFTSKTKNGPPSGIVFLHTYTSMTEYNKQASVSIEQRWEADTVFYHSIRMLSVKDGTVLYANEWWPHKIYRVKNDTGSWIVYPPLSSDPIKSFDFRKMEQSFKDYAYNWFNDLFLFPHLSYKPGRTFKVIQKNSAGEYADVQYYTVGDTAIFKTDNGQDIICWLVEHKPFPHQHYYKKYWVQPSTGVVWKQEDYMNGIFRYRVRLTIDP